MNSRPTPEPPDLFEKFGGALTRKPYQRRVQVNVFGTLRFG